MIRDRIGRLRNIKCLLMPERPTNLADACERVPLSPGVFVYRRRSAPEAGSKSDPEALDPPRYLCPPCLDSGIESELRREESVAAVHQVCPRCRATFLERKKPLSGLAMSPWG